MSALLGVLVASAPGAAVDDFPLWEALARAAIAQGWAVEVFLMDDAVAYAADPRFQALLELGVEAVACATDAARRGVEGEALEAAGVRAGSQRDHGRLIRRSQRFVAFT